MHESSDAEDAKKAEDKSKAPTVRYGVRKYKAEISSLKRELKQAELRNDQLVQLCSEWRHAALFPDDSEDDQVPAGEEVSKRACPCCLRAKTARGFKEGLFVKG